MFNYTLLGLTALTFLLVSCGTETTQADRVMEKGELYTVSKGDIVVKASEVATIKVIHIDKENTSTISLLGGNATITHP